MLKELDLIENDALSTLDAIEDLETLEQWRLVTL